MCGRSASRIYDNHAHAKLDRAFFVSAVQKKRLLKVAALGSARKIDIYLICTERRIINVAPGVVLNSRDAIIIKCVEGGSLDSNFRLESAAQITRLYIRFSADLYSSIKFLFLIARSTKCIASAL